RFIAKILCLNNNIQVILHLMKKINTLSLLLVLFVLFLSSCYSKKNILYFYDLKDSNTWSQPITNDVRPRFQKDDRISVKVLTMDQGTTNLLNSGVLINSNVSGTGAGGGESISTNTANQDGYIVDADGNITLQFIGKVKADGLTKHELTEE